MINHHQSLSPEGGGSAQCLASFSLATPGLHIVAELIQAQVLNTDAGEDGPFRVGARTRQAY